MGAGPVINPYNLRPPYTGLITRPDGTGVASDEFNRYLRNLTTVIQNIAGINVNQYGVRGNGVADDGPAFQTAINDAVNQGGGTIIVPSGNFAIGAPLVIPATYLKKLPDGSQFPNTPTGPIRFVGQGNSTIILRIGDMPTGHGMFDIYSSDVSFENMMIDGNVLVSTGLRYNLDFNGIGGNDPMAPSLTKNTSIWVHGPASSFSMNTVTVQHTGGYAVLADATTGTIEDIDIIACVFMNNRPSVFGTATVAPAFGSWNGGIFLKGDGRTIGSGTVNDVNVSLCHFERDTGNCLWLHSYGLVELHKGFRAIGNNFIDCGLDGILVGAVTGGAVNDNVFRRVGYVCSDDTSPSVPRWLPNLQATALDSSGIVLNVPYEGNSFLDINGGAIDLDGHGQSAITGNIIRVAAPGDPEYVIDQVAICGPNNNAQEGYGINMGNSAATALGASNVTIVGNTFVNLSGGSIRLFAARDCLVEGNTIISPGVPVGPPISIGPTGVGANQRATRNKICHNFFYYNPGSALPCVFEDNTITPFVGTDINQVFGNVPIQPAGTAAIEFHPDGSSGSPTYLMTIWF